MTINDILAAHKALEALVDKFCEEVNRQTGEELSAQPYETTKHADGWEVSVTLKNFVQRVSFSQADLEAIQAGGDRLRDLVAQRI